MVSTSVTKADVIEKSLKAFNFSVTSAFVEPALGMFHLFINWAASSEVGTYRLCKQRRFRGACTFVQSRQNLRCLFIQAVSQEEPSDRKPDP